MAEFSLFSDTDESETVEQILAEAMDHCVLQQIAAINCSSFSNSLLPSNLESRFQRLKTQLTPDSVNELNYSVNSPQCIEEKSRKNPEKMKKSSSGSSNSSSEHLSSPNFYPKNGENKGKDENFQGKNGNFTCKKGKDEDSQGKNGNFLSRSPSFGSNSSDSSTKTVKTGCFWCSPKKKTKKNNKNVENRTRMFELDGDDNWGKHDEILSDLKSFSEKKQKKLMKLQKKEEEKISKEAEEIVKWAKQASARVDFSGIVDDDHDLSDDDHDHHHGHNFGLH